MLEGFFVGFLVGRVREVLVEFVMLFCLIFIIFRE